MKSFLKSSIISFNAAKSKHIEFTKSKDGPNAPFHMQGNNILTVESAPSTFRGSLVEQWVVAGEPMVVQATMELSQSPF